MEVTVISAEGLRSSSSALFSNRLRPFITITVAQPAECNTNGDKKCHVYTTRVDDQGGVNPKWGDKFHIPVDATFFANRYSSIHLRLYTKRLIGGQTQLGWCQVRVTDIGFPPVGSMRHLSYRLREKDGSKGHGIVNIAVKVTGSLYQVASQRTSSETCRTVIGVPITVFPHVGEGQPHELTSGRGGSFTYAKKTS